MTAGVPVAARRRGGENAMPVLLDGVAEAEEDGAQAIRMPATGVTAETAAAVGIAVVAGGEDLIQNSGRLQNVCHLVHPVFLLIKSKAFKLAVRKRKESLSEIKSYPQYDIIKPA